MRGNSGVTRAGLAVAAAMTMAAPAMAADHTPMLADPSHPVWLVLDIGGGVFRGEESGTFDGGTYDYEETAHGTEYFVEGSAVIEVSPHLSFQIDAWNYAFNEDGDGFDTEGGSYTFDDWGTGTGVGGHVTWNGDNHRFGFSGDLQFGYDVYGSLELEGVFHHDNWSLGGYAGVEKGLTGFAAYVDDTEWYGTLYATYYATPNLAIGAFGRLWTGTVNYDDSEAQGGSWGAAIEYKHDDKPFSVYAQFTHYTGDASDNDPDSWSWSSNYVGVGVRWFGRDATLQETDRHVF